MKKSEYRGFAQVFHFTFTQAVSARSFQITMLIMILVAACAFPILNYMNRTTDEKSPIETIYVINETNLPQADFGEALKEEEGLSEIAVTVAEKDYETLEKEITKSEKNEVILTAGMDETTGAYMLEFAMNPDSEVESTDVSEVASVMSKWFEKYKVQVLDVSEESMEMINKTVSHDIVDTKEYTAEEKEVISQADYNVVYAMLMIVYMVTVFASSAVAGKVVEEKANRVVEYLMTTVRPMALILGKVTAMLLVTIGEIVLIVVAGAISNKVSANIFGTKSSDLLSQFLSMDAIKSMSPVNIVISILILAIGVFIYGMIAGLFGASVSKMEDLQQGLKTYNFVIIIAFFASMAALQMMWTVGINNFVGFTMLFPLTSVLILPGAILIGKASLWIIVVALVLQLITAFLVLKFVSTVYESIIVMNGNPITLKQMIAMVKKKNEIVANSKEKSKEMKKEGGK